jgi:hypothetical protein
MPATSSKQKKFMDAAAHNPEFAKEAGIPIGVAQEFSTASKRKKFGSDSRADLQVINKPKTDHGKSALFKKGGDVKKLFGGKETYAEELKEAKAVKSKKITPKQFEKGEKAEGHKEEPSLKIAKSIKSGSLSPARYAEMESKEPARMKKGGKVKKFGMGGDVVQMPNMSDPKYQDPAYVAAGQANADRMNTMLENARNSGVAPDYSEFDVSPMLKAGGEDINSLYGSMLGRAPDPTGIAANRGASADTIRKSILASPEYQNRGMATLKKGGAVKKATGGSVKKMASGGSTSRRGDGIAQRGKTRGKMC